MFSTSEYISIWSSLIWLTLIVKTEDDVLPHTKCCHTVSTVVSLWFIWFAQIFYLTQSWGRATLFKAYQVLQINFSVSIYKKVDCVISKHGYPWKKTVQDSKQLAGCDQGEEPGLNGCYCDQLLEPLNSSPELTLEVLTQRPLITLPVWVYHIIFFQICDLSYLMKEEKTKEDIEEKAPYIQERNSKTCLSE